MFLSLFRHSAGLTQGILPNLSDGQDVGILNCRFDTILPHAPLYA